jgi:hypothetical protein
VRPSSRSKASIVGFQRFSQFRVGPTTKAASNDTGPSGSPDASCRHASICSLNDVDVPEATVRTMLKL